MAEQKNLDVRVVEMKMGEFEIDFNHAKVTKAFWRKTARGGYVLVLEVGTVFKYEQEKNFLETLKHLKSEGIPITQIK